jgi:AcrR family transcriptional regulator
MEERKLYIIKNAGQLYLKFGIRNITMDSVATELGISKKTLYQYFKDKEDLISQVIDFYMSDGLQLEIKNPSSKNAIDNMFCYRERIADLLKFYHNHIETELKKTYPAMHEKLHETKRKRIFDDTIENIKLGISQGLYRPDVEPSFVAKLSLGRMLYTMNPEYGIFEDFELNSLSFFDSILDYHMHAICTEEGLKHYKKQLKKVQNETKN